MIIEIKIPSPGESISEVEITNWLVQDGEYVSKDQEIAEVESEKATLTIVADEGGMINIKIDAGTTAKVGDVACTIDTEKQGKVKPVVRETKEQETPVKQPIEEKKNAIKVTPLAQNIINKNDLSTEDILNGNKRIGKKEVNAFLNSEVPLHNKGIEREITRKPMSQLRKKISERLVTAKNETAMLTTFNEVDMLAVMNLRNKYKEQFLNKYGIKPGFMSFFTKAASIALQQFKNINAKIEGEDILFHNYTDIGIAVQTDKGLMVPVLKDVNAMKLPEIELKIAELAEKARTKKITIEELEGGTFTISNGGVFGSMLSTPIINYPQAAIMGMHNITERPVAINGKVEVRPVMYLALSYDHRIIDGKDSVSFLLKVKELIENPVNLLFDGNNPEKILLNL